MEQTHVVLTAIALIFISSRIGFGFDYDLRERKNTEEHRLWSRLWSMKDPFDHA